MRIVSPVIHHARPFHQTTPRSAPDPSNSNIAGPGSMVHKEGWVKPTVPVIESGTVGQTQSVSSNMPMLTMEGMMAAFGTNDPTYDFNADGIVNIEDFSHFLVNGNLMPHPNAGLTAEGFEHALGSSNSSYDLNGDGTVTTDDFSQWLVNYGQGHAPTEASAPETNISKELHTPMDLSQSNPLAIRGSALFGQQAAQLYEQLWNHSGNMPPRQLLFGA